MKFFTNDWMGDLTLRRCGLEARGLWLELLCLMHQSPKRGYLVGANLEALEPAELAKLVGVSLKKFNALLGELFSKGVASRDEGGVLFNRRMAKELETSEARSKAGKVGGDRCILLKQNSSKDDGFDEAKFQANPGIWNMDSSSPSESKFMSGDGGVGEGEVLPIQKNQPPGQSDVIPISGTSNPSPKPTYAQGCHNFDLRPIAKKIATFHIETVKTTNTKIGDETINAIIRAMVEEGVTEESFKQASRDLAEEMETKKTEPGMRLSPWSFFTKGHWRDHVGPDRVKIISPADAKRQQEREQEAIKTAEYRRIRGIDKKSAAS